MNALELADWIENGAPFGKYETAKQAVVMLRQQQAEIEVLTKFLDETCQIGKFIVWNSTDKAQEK